MAWKNSDLFCPTCKNSKNIEEKTGDFCHGAFFCTYHAMTWTWILKWKSHFLCSIFFPSPKTIKDKKLLFSPKIIKGILFGFFPLIRLKSLPRLSNLVAPPNFQKKWPCEKNFLGKWKNFDTWLPREARKNFWK